MRSVIWPALGVVAVFGAYVVLPFLFVSALRSDILPTWISSLADAVDPAIWMILLPLLLAVLDYSYVFRHCGVSSLANRRLVRWPAAIVAAFLSLNVELFWIFNTFGS